MEEYHQVKQELNNKKSNKGLIAAIIIVIILAIGAIGGTWYYMNNKAKKDKKAQEEQIQQLEKQTQELNDKIKEFEQKLASQSQASSQQTEILKQVKGAYEYWLNGGNPDSPVSYQALKDKNFITQTFLDFQKTSNQSFDLLTCSQNALPFKDYVFKDPTLKDSNSAEAIVEANYQGSGVTAIKLGVVKDNAIWKINTITCPNT